MLLRVDLSVADAVEAAAQETGPPDLVKHLAGIGKPGGAS